LTCWSAGCGIHFAVPLEFDKRNFERGNCFYCPNGHKLYYGEGEADRLRKELAQEKKFKEWAQQDAKIARKNRERAERQLSATKGVVTKIKKRVGNGVCPCCKRSFTNLRRHMHTKHPDYKDG
jgi:hypothetical protein